MKTSGNPAPSGKPRTYLIVVMLATSSSGERSFSSVKTYLMGESRLNHLMLLKHKELLDNMDLYQLL